jgi:non-specific serine/threonine protein kinase
MADIFLSYASEDRDRVAPLVAEIERLGISVWWDRRIGLGASFDREIERELDLANCIVVVWTANSIESDWVRNEAHEGLERNALVPVLLESVKPPLAFRRAQNADLTQPGALEELLGALQKRFPHESAPVLQESEVNVVGLYEADAELPLRSNSFVGRQEEINEIGNLFKSSRLVTLTGVGGAGKTRLGLQFATEFDRNGFDTVRLVELAALTDAEIVADEVAERLGAKIPYGGTSTTAIATQVADNRVLLMMDNCEHLVESVANLVEDLIQNCPNLHVLATSQRPLGLSQERRYAVPPLPMPSGVDLASIASSDAVQLFLQRAKLVRPEFSVDESNAASVAAICRQLDGIPLAIELAAARVRVLSPAQIAKRLDGRLRFLVSSDRDSADRHRTLVAALEWSHDLLPDSERALFRRLAVFNGSFDIDAAEVVCEAPPIATPDVLELLTSLVDKSLVVTQLVDESMRYVLLASIRAYALERLAASGEDLTSQVRHASHFLNVTKELQRQLRSRDTKSATTGLQAEEDNLRAALEFSLDEEELEIAAGIIGALGHIWYTSGLFREGIDWGRRLLAKSPKLDDELLAEVLHSYGTLLGSWERPDTGVEVLEQELQLRRKLKNTSRLAAVLNNLGNMLAEIGRTEEAESHLREAIAVFRDSGECAALSFCSLASEALRANRLSDSIEHCQEALSEAQKYNDEYALALATMFLGECALRKGDRVGAQQQIEQAKSSFFDLGVHPGVANGDLLLGILHLQEGDRSLAAKYFLDALEVPDGHWYLSTKYWLLQIAAVLCTDVQLKARLIATAAEHYDQAIEIQPVWVMDELTLLQSEISDLGIREYPFMNAEEAIEVARRVFDELTS